MLAGRESPYPEQTVIEQYFTKQPTAAFVRLNQLNYTKFVQLPQFVFDNFRCGLLSFPARQRVLTSCP